MCYRLTALGLLPLCRLVEADPGADPREAARRFNFDRSLLAALVDRWRPETHTFHLPVGEMAPTLEDVTLLLGLPCAGQAVGPVDVGPAWRMEMHERFVGVVRTPAAPAYQMLPASETHGPRKKWLLQFSVNCPYLLFFVRTIPSFNCEH